MTKQSISQEDYTVWLIPISRMIYRADYPLDGKPSDRTIFQEERYTKLFELGWMVLVVTLVAWIAFMVLARLQRNRFGHAHLYLTIWLLCCLPTPFIVNPYFINIRKAYTRLW